MVLNHSRSLPALGIDKRAGVICFISVRVNMNHFEEEHNGTYHCPNLSSRSEAETVIERFEKQT